MRTLQFDYETYSEADLTAVGTSRYARHPSTEVLLCGYSIDSGDVGLWQPALGEPMPDDLLDALIDPQCIKQAWNAAFERAITTHVLGIKTRISAWRCTMVKAYYCGLPGNLGKCGEALGMDQDKKKNLRAKRLINKFCCPQKTTKKRTFERSNWLTDPDEWAEFAEYCRQDVVAEQAIDDYLSFIEMPQREWNAYGLDQLINDRGIPIDIDMVRAADDTCKALAAEYIDEMRQISGLSNPNSPAQLLPYLRTIGYPYNDLKAGHVKKALLEAADPDLRRLLYLRLETSKSAVKKFSSLLQQTDDDGNIRNCFQFMGAQRTGRFAGRNLQPQNLKKAPKEYEHCIGEVAEHLKQLDHKGFAILYPDALDAAAACIRPAIRAPEGYTLIDADLSAIENVSLGYLAREEKILRVFRENKDPYIDFAQYLYRESYDALFEQYKAGDKSKRTVAKPAVLGCLGHMTLVLTDRGLISIKYLTTEHKVFDGENWVEHGGLAYKGQKDCINIDGVKVTRDHEFLVNSRWIQAQYLTPQNRVDMNFTPDIPNLLDLANRHIDFDKATGTGTAHTFDVLNAGPRNRFTIRTRAGFCIVHNCGYGLGAGKTWIDEETGEEVGSGLMGYAANMGIKLTQDEANQSVETFRKTYYKVPELWKRLEKAFIDCTETGATQHIWPFVVYRTGRFVAIKLPSGRSLHYCDAFTYQKMTPWGEYRPAPAFYGVNDKNQWGVIDTYGAKLVENVTQAFARDVLVHGMVLAHKQKIETRLHVHDQVVAISPKDKSKEQLEILVQCLSTPPEWAKELPLNANGFISDYFTKD